MDHIKFWEKQYRRNIDRVIGICYLYTGDRSVAEDLAQDVFVKAMVKFRSIRAVLAFDSWLKRIAVNQCIDYLRQQPDFVPLPPEIADESVSVVDSSKWEVDVTEEELLDTIKQLPVLQRTVFNLFAIEGYPHRRIAEMLNISVDYSKQLHRRARVRLRKTLSDKYMAKEKTKKGLSMAFLLSLLKKANSNPRRIDRLYRSRLSSFRLSPTHPFTASEIGKAAATVPGKIGVSIAAHKTALLLIAATGAAGGAIAWQVGSNASTGMDSGKPPIPVEASVGESRNAEESITDSDSITVSKHIASIQTEPRRSENPHKTSLPSDASVPPVIITKRVPVHKTVVIRDTTIIADTTLITPSHE